MRAAGLVTAALLGLAAPGTPAAPPKKAASVDAWTPWAEVSRRLVEPSGFRDGDLDLLINYRAAVPKTPPAVETLLRRPGSVDSLVPALRAALRPVAPADPWSWLGIVPDAGTPRKTKLPVGVFAQLMGGTLSTYASALSPEEIAFLRSEAPALFRPSEEDTLRTPVEVEIDRLRGRAVTDSVMTLAARLPKPLLAAAARDLEVLVGDLLRATRESPERIYEELLTLRASGVPVVIGTPEDDVHRLDRGIVFDPSGNDRYEFPDSARPGSWLLVIDLAGDDVYQAADTAGGAAAFLGLQVIHDAAGNDRYEAQDFAFGAALFGYSRLYDGGGDDRYVARCASLGFAFEGVGLLRDAGGDDVYSSAYMAQGAAGPGGLAALIDERGDDRYESRPVFADDLRYRDHYLSLSQGFSTGFAPDHAGGIAVLWDFAGKDSYVADIYGQGAGYWFAWGLLMDDAGDDSMRAYQYAQGAGVHFAGGTLLDAAGDDVRVSKGVSQGCGHDGGFGLLADRLGNDSTTAVDMSAGAGNANGLGVYVDLAGDDVYIMGDPHKTLGHADMRRDRGSLGFFLDLPGRNARRDALPAPFEEGAVRRVYDGERRGNGFGLDAK